MGERHLPSYRRAKRLRKFVREAAAADAAIDAGGDVYRAEDVHAWLDRLADNPEAGGPRPWRN